MALTLPSTQGAPVRLSELTGLRVLFCYPVFPPDRHASEVLAWLSR